MIIEDKNRSKPTWERILWKKQNYPDNYVGNSFFRVCTKSHKVSYWQALFGSILVAQEISSCVVLVSIFLAISGRHVSTSSVIVFCAIFTTLGYVIAYLPQNTWTRYSKKASLFSYILNDFKVAAFTLVLIWLSSPIIKSLTASVSTDTIHACSTGLLLLHLVLHAYGADVAIVNSTMSQNLGLFASVCLASRLECNKDVFALMIVAVIFFNLLPSFRNRWQESFGKRSTMCLSAALFLGSLGSLLLYAPYLCFLFVVVYIFVTGVSPLLFIYLQPFRKNIYGPWDEALIDEKH